METDLPKRFGRNNIEGVTNAHAKALGKLGGKARAKAMTADEHRAASARMNEARDSKLTPERKREIALAANAARWKDHPKRRQGT